MSSPPQQIRQLSPVLENKTTVTTSYIYSKKNSSIFIPIYEGKFTQTPILWVKPLLNQMSNITVPISDKEDTEQQKSKLRYMIISPLPPIIQDTTPDQLKSFLFNLFINRANMKETEAKRYLDDVGIKKFMNAITHVSVNPKDSTNNYEMLEHFGDANVNKAATWFLKSAFPEIVAKGNLGLQIFNRQKALIVSKLFLARYCERINLDKLIRYRQLPYYYLDSRSQTPPVEDMNIVNLNFSMKEDVFEALMGCIEDVIDSKEGFVGIGYSIVFKILSSIYSEERIPKTRNELVDYKTQLKEIFDRFKSNENYNFAFIHDKDTSTMSLILFFKGDKYIVGPPNIPIEEQTSDFIIGIGPIPLKGTGGELEVYKNIAERQLAKEALSFFRKYYPDESRLIRFKAGE